MKKFIIVHHHLLFRRNLKLFVENEGFGKVIGEAENGTEFLDLLRTHEPDFIITDAGMPPMHESDKTKITIIDVPNLNVTNLTLPDYNWHYPDSVKSEPAAFIDKLSGKLEFEEAFRAILSGKIWELS